MCLRILRSMVDGPAAKIIRHHLVDVDDPAGSLQGALDTLKMAYGTNFKQGRAQLKALIARPDVPPTERGLMEFYSDLDSCFKVMTRCECASDLDSLSVLEKLFPKLPEYLQNKWEKLVDRSPARRATFQTLMEVVRREHSLKSGMLNVLREEKLEEVKSSEAQELKEIQINYADTKDIPQQPLRVPDQTQSQRSGQPPPCLCAPIGIHPCLLDCPEYLQTPSVSEKWNLVRRMRVCFCCLRYGHRSYDCRNGPCGVGGCMLGHHSSLHHMR